MPEEILQKGPQQSNKSLMWVIAILLVLVIGTGAFIMVSRDAAAKDQLNTEQSVEADDSVTDAATDETSATTTNTDSSSEVFSLNNLRNASVVIGSNENLAANTYKLLNGSYADSTGVYDKPSSIVLDEAKITLDSNNTNQAAIILNVQYGGSGTVKVLEVMGNKGGIPQEIANVQLNDGQAANIISVAFSSDTITVNMLVSGPDDPQSSPTINKTVSYTLTSDSQLILK